jgi:hypothetical protein
MPHHATVETKKFRGSHEIFEDIFSELPVKLSALGTGHLMLTMLTMLDSWGCKHVEK